MKKIIGILLCMMVFNLSSMAYITEEDERLFRIWHKQIEEMKSKEEDRTRQLEESHRHTKKILEFYEKYPTKEAREAYYRRQRILEVVVILGTFFSIIAFIIFCFGYGAYKKKYGARASLGSYLLRFLGKRAAKKIEERYKDRGNRFRMGSE